MTEKWMCRFRYTWCGVVRWAEVVLEGEQLVSVESGGVDITEKVRDNPRHAEKVRQCALRVLRKERKLIVRYIVELERMEGEETTIHLASGGEPVPRLWCVVSAGPRGAAIVDQGYRTLAEARVAWPEAIPPSPAALTRDAADESHVIDRGKTGIE